MRRASLRAVARLRGEVEPTPQECDAADWSAGLAGAYRSLPVREKAVEAGAVGRAGRYRPPLAWVAAAAAAAFGVTLSLAPPSHFWESRGHLPPVRVLGVPDAADNVIFRVLARVWGVALSPFAPEDQALTLFAAATVAASAAAVFLLLHRLLSRSAQLPGLGAAPAAGALMAVLLGVWMLRSAGARLPDASPYHLSGALAAGGAWTLLLWRDRRGDPRSERWLSLGAYLIALGLAGPILWALPLACAAVLALRFRPRRPVGG